MKKPPLTLEQDLAVQMLNQMGSSALDSSGNLNVILLKTIFDVNRVPPDLQPVILQDISTIIDEIKASEDGKQDPTHH